MKLRVLVLFTSLALQLLLPDRARGADEASDQRSYGRSGDCDGAPWVSIYALLAVPERWEGSRVNLRGSLFHSFEGSHMFADSELCDPLHVENSVRVHLDRLGGDRERIRRISQGCWEVQACGVVHSLQVTNSTEKATVYLPSSPARVDLLYLRFERVPPMTK